MDPSFKILTSSFMKSAPKMKDAPETEPDCPEITFVGRSNVGKSSLINALCARKNLAKTSNTPGKTRLMNFYQIDTLYQEHPQTLYFVDLPGYGYAKVSKTEQQAWQKALQHYLDKRESLSLVVQLIDARHGPKEQDHQMNDWLVYQGKSRLVVLTKMDKLKRQEQHKSLEMTGKAFDIAPSELISFSAVNRQGVDECWRLQLEKVFITG
jgi:GTP-binding protein